MKFLDETEADDPILSVVNLIDVSFVENLPYDGEPGTEVRDLLPTRLRALLTLERFLGGLTHALGGTLPAGFVVTLPKVRRAVEVEVLSSVLASIEGALGLEPRAIGVELMIEQPDALFDDDGRIALPALLQASDGRCAGLHMGSYDFTASLGIAAPEQRLAHPSCD